MDKRHLISALVLVVLINLVSSKHPKHPYEIDIGDSEEIAQKYRIHSTECHSNSGGCFDAYIRLAKFLLRQERFVRLENGEYHAQLDLRLTEQQFDLIDAGLDGLNLHEIDQLMNEIAPQSSVIDAEKLKSLMFEHYRFELNQMMASVLGGNTLLIGIGVVIITALVIRRDSINLSSISFSAIIITIVLAMVAFSIVLEFMECSDDLETEVLVKMHTKDLHNPCKQLEKEGQSTFMSMFTAYFGSSEEACRLHMKKTLKPTRKYCDPVIVLSTWTAKIQMSYLGSVLGGFIKLMGEQTEGMNILGKIVTWTGGCLVFVFIFVTLAKAGVITTIRGFFSCLRKTTVTTEIKSATSEADDSSKIKIALLQQEVRLLRELSVERTLPTIREKPSKGSKAAEPSNLEAIEENQNVEVES